MQSRELKYILDICIGYLYSTSALFYFSTTSNSELSSNLLSQRVLYERPTYELRKAGGVSMAPSRGQQEDRSANLKARPEEKLAAKIEETKWIIKRLERLLAEQREVEEQHKEQEQEERKAEEWLRQVEEGWDELFWRCEEWHSSFVEAVKEDTRNVLVGFTKGCGGGC